MSAFIRPGKGGLENKLPAPNRTARSMHRYLVLFNFMDTCLLGVTAEESSKPFFHFTWYTQGLENKGLQYQRTGQWGDHTHPCAPREGQQLAAAPTEAAAASREALTPTGET